MAAPTAASGGSSRRPGEDQAASEEGPRVLPLDRHASQGPHAGHERGIRQLPSLASTRRATGARSRPAHTAGRLADVTRRAVDRLRGRFARLSVELGQLDGGRLAEQGESTVVRRLAADLEGLAETLLHLGDLVETTRPPSSAPGRSAMTACPAEAIEAVVAETKTAQDGPLPRIVVDAPGDDTVAAPSGTLSRILRTLVRNAIDAAGPRGEVVLTSVAYDDAVEIEVADSGHGLSGHARAWLFEPGFSTKTDGEGLALAAACCLAERLAGGIDVINCPDGGTAFILRLPRPSARQRAA